MNYATSYDRWLTTPYDDGYDSFVEASYELVKEQVWSAIEAEQYAAYKAGHIAKSDLIVERLWEKGRTPEQVSQILNRLYR